MRKGGKTATKRSSTKSTRARLPAWPSPFFGFSKQSARVRHTTILRFCPPACDICSLVISNQILIVDSGEMFGDFTGTLSKVAHHAGLPPHDFEYNSIHQHSSNACERHRPELFAKGARYTTPACFSQKNPRFPSSIFAQHRNVYSNAERGSYLHVCVGTISAIYSISSLALRAGAYIVLWTIYV